MGMSCAPAVTRALGYAGLIPFVLPALLVLSGSAYGSVATEFAGTYALASNNMVVNSSTGVQVNPFTHKFSLSPRHSVNYMLSVLIAIRERRH